MTKHRETQLHYLMCVNGGLLGAYSLLRCGAIFGAAQTANLICALEALLGHEPRQFLLRLLGLLIYIAGIISYVFVTRKTAWDPKKWVLSVQGSCLVLLGLLPPNADPFLCLYPIFYMLSVQWSAFGGACGFSASTIFSTNNIRQFSLGLTEYFFTGKEKDAVKARFYGITLLSYHLGTAAALIAYPVLGRATAWLSFVLLGTATPLIFDPHRHASGQTSGRHLYSKG